MRTEKKMRKGCVYEKREERPKEKVYQAQQPDMGDEEVDAVRQMLRVFYLRPGAVCGNQSVGGIVVFQNTD